MMYGFNNGVTLLTKGTTLWMVLTNVQYMVYCTVSISRLLSCLFFSFVTSLGQRMVNTYWVCAV